MIPLKRSILATYSFLFLLMIASCETNVQPIKKAVAIIAEKQDSIVQKPIDPFKWEPIKYDTTKNYIYLTFDDGPQNGTMACLELLKKLNVKATFFMVGSHVKSNNLRNIVRTIKANYPQILLANHSTTHANNHYQYFYHHPEMAAEDFYLAQQTLAVPYKIIRLPGNSAWVIDTTIKASKLVKPVCYILDSSGYNVIGWDVEWSFNHKTAYPVQQPWKIANQVDSALVRGHVHTKNHVVILSHDRMFRKENFTDSLAKFITILKQDPKNVFETIDHYPGMKF
jgi:peptidoglycan/xylan/chitin deacetylase (PgdA/CDA1 family)